MTAIIGILNKSAVALAADSAVTVGTGRTSKVYNHANKIFNLSTENNVAIMIYNSAEFLGVPWETVIKEYRRSTKKVFQTTKAHSSDFVSFLKRFRVQHKIDSEDATLSLIINNLLNTIDSDLDELILESFPETKVWNNLPGSQRVQVYKSAIETILRTSIGRISQRADLPTHKADSVQTILRKFSRVITSISIGFLEQYELEDDRQLHALIQQLIALSIKKDIFMESWSGLVFVGFGSKEIYPSFVTINVGGVINNKIRYHVDIEDKVAQDNDSIILPFAQTDIMATFVEGIDPFVWENIPASLESALNEFKKYIISNIDFSTKKEQQLRSLLEKSIPKVVRSLLETLNTVKLESHIGPMLATIRSLSKEDLTDLAESLINLTYLKRRATFGEESVGGPVDVAVITKGDGLIWIKRKHYFKPELNLNYVAKVNQLV